MTKKDYEKMAAALAKFDHSPIDHDTDPYVVGRRIGISDAIYALSEVFRKDNPRFDQDRFLAACGLK